MDRQQLSGAFLQSRGWEVFQRSLGKEVRRMNDTLWIKQSIRGPFYYWYCPRGVVTELPNDGIFLRVDPMVAISYPLSLVPAPHSVQPPTTIFLDLTKSTDDLLKEMHQKTRYNIRVAERDGVRVQIGGKELFDSFWSLMEKTTARDGFRAHPKSYYQAMLEDHGDTDLRVFVALATVAGQPAAAALMLDFGKTRTYLHGASDHALRESMAPYALHWVLIQDAKQQGLTAYDWWGIASSDDPKEPLAGVTRFKKGWGGTVIRYPSTVDVPLCPWAYRIYRLAYRLLR